MAEKIAIIGAGIAGIAVAVRLAAKGFHVEVFEKNDGPGGKMSQIRHEGFRFDTGPSLFTLPGLITELYELAGENVGDYFEFKKLENVCRYFYEDDLVIDAKADPEEFAAELSTKAGEDEEKVRDYLKESGFIFNFTYPVFIRNSLHIMRNYFSGDFLKSFFLLPRIKPFQTLHQVNLKYFRHPATINLFDRFATYNGSDPYKTPATLMVIPHLEHNIGAYFPKGGMHQSATSLVSLAEKLGVVFHYNCEVTEVMVGRQRPDPVGWWPFQWGRNRNIFDRKLAVTGLRTANGKLRNDFRSVITDLDIYFVYKNLLKDYVFPEKWFRHERSTSALIFYWGMQLNSDRLVVHNILFSNDYKQEFKCLFELKSIHSDPTIYIFISSKIVPEDAPEGYENWFVMINTPPDEGQDWDTLINEARLVIEEKIERKFGIMVREKRIFEFIMDPRGIESRTASYKGSLYGNSSNSMFAAFQRHPNFSKIRGLYHVGGSVHPGGGIPLCLSSAKIVSDMLSLKNK